jgi:aquaporin Z
VGGWAVQQLWLFWIAPIAGGVLAGITHRWMSAKTDN